MTALMDLHSRAQQCRCHTRLRTNESENWSSRDQKDKAHRSPLVWRCSLTYASGLCIPLGPKCADAIKPWILSNHNTYTRIRLPLLLSCNFSKLISMTCNWVITPVHEFLRLSSYFHLSRFLVCSVLHSRDCFCNSFSRVFQWSPIQGNNNESIVAFPKGLAHGRKFLAR